jgi:hypothetical protein
LQSGFRVANLWWESKDFQGRFFNWRVVAGGVDLSQGRKGESVLNAIFGSVLIWFCREFFNPFIYGFLRLKPGSAKWAEINN